MQIVWGEAYEEQLINKNILENYTKYYAAKSHIP